MFALQTILILVIISGFIAYVGDNVGRSIGRKRVTLFGLRPRYTAIAVTVVTGSLIAFITGAILVTFSSDVRTALFGMDKLKGLISQHSSELEQLKVERQKLTSDINRLQSTLVASKSEIDSLLKTKDSLTKEINTARSGSLLFRVNDPITITTIDSKGSTEDIKNILLKILSDTDTAIKKTLKGTKKQYISIPSDELDEASEYIMSNPGSMVVRLIAARNVMVGEDIPVHFEIFENSLIFKAEEIIASETVNGSASLPSIEQTMKDLLSTVNSKAIDKGIIPDPEGSVGTIPYSRIFEVAKTIKARNKPVKINVNVTKDIYSIGPLDIELEIVTGK